MALGFVGTLVAARGLGPNRYGAVVLAVSVASVVAVFLDLTLEDAVVFFGSQALARGRYSDLRHLLRTSFTTDLVIGVTVVIGVVVAAGPLASLVGGGPVDATLVRLAALSGLAVTVDGTTGAILLLAGRQDLRAFSLAWGSLLRLGLLWVAVRSGGTEAVVMAFAGAALVGALTQAYLAWRVGWRRWLPDGARTGEGPGVRGLVTFGVHSSIYTSALALRRGAVSIVLGNAAGARAVGIFDVSMFPVSVADIASAPVKLSLLPEQARLAASGETEVLRQSVRWYTIVALAVGVPGAVAGWFLLPWLIGTFYSDAFAAAVGPARVLLIAALISLVMGWAKIFPVAVGRPQARTLITLAELAALVVLMVTLRGHGAMGAAISVTGAMAIGAAAWWLTASRWLDWGARGAKAGAVTPAGPGPATRTDPGGPA
jgi:O-antigen/teichoic acid export membrane protein